jgi:excisionase family DNA binding protein
MVTFQLDLPPTQALLRVSEAQAATGLGKTSIYELLATNRLERVRIGAATRITRRSVERLIAESLTPGERVIATAPRLGPAPSPSAAEG